MTRDVNGDANSGTSPGPDIGQHMHARRQGGGCGGCVLSPLWVCAARAGQSGVRNIHAWLRERRARDGEGSGPSVPCMGMCDWIVRRSRRRGVPGNSGRGSVGHAVRGETPPKLHLSANHPSARSTRTVSGASATKQALHKLPPRGTWRANTVWTHGRRSCFSTAFHASLCALCMPARTRTPRASCIYRAPTQRAGGDGSSTM